MTSRERVLAALNHEQPDAVPSEYFGTPEIEDALLKHFGVDSHDALLTCLGTDLRMVEPDYIGPELKTFEDGSFEDIWGVIKAPMQNEFGAYNESSYLPFEEMTTLEQVAAHRWPSPDWYDYSSLPEKCRQYEGYAVYLGRPGYMDLINGIAFGRGVEQVIMDIATEEPVFLELMDRRARFFLQHCDQALTAAKGRIDILFMGDDYGTQNGLLMHPDTWRKLFKPRMKAMIDLAHSHNAKVVHHCCGSSRAIMEDFIEIGLDCLQTIQPQAVGMDPDELKADFGDRLCFHGAIDVQGGLQNGTPEEIRTMVLDRIATMNQNGGYICGPSHNIQPDTPLENVLAMYEAIQETRRVQRPRPTR